MRLVRRLSGLLAVLLLCGSALAQRTAAAKQQLDPQIAAAVKEVSPARVKATIEKLVSFGTRNSLSSNDPEMAKQGKGVVAAREWIKSEF